MDLLRKIHSKAFLLLFNDVVNMFNFIRNKLWSFAVCRMKMSVALRYTCNFGGYAQLYF